MASPRPPAPAAALLLLGLAAVCRGISVRPNDGLLPMPGMPRPFEHTSDAIMVYSAGKTGTTSLQYTAGNMIVPPCRVAGVSERHRAVKCHYHACALNFLRGRPQGSRTWVISSNRNPFARIPSALFQGLGHRWTSQQMVQTPVSEIIRLLHEGEGRDKDQIHGVPDVTTAWFRESYEPLGLNISAFPFDFDKKLLRLHHTFEGRQLEILVVRLEDSAQWEAILRPFFPNIQLITGNQAGNKSDAYNNKYEEFMSALHYSSHEIETISQSEDLAQFYTLEERNAFIRSARDSSARLTSVPSVHSEDRWDGDDSCHSKLGCSLPKC